MRVGHLGPAGTFTEQAAREADGELIPYPTVPATVAAVLGGEVDVGVVPIENSTEGTVTATVDALGREERLRIVGESVLAVRQCLVALEDVALENVEEVRSHPQALAQCERFLRERVGQARLVPVESTAEAVLSLDWPGAVAVASRGAAAMHGALVVCEDIQDSDENATRFAWLALGGQPVPRAAGGAAWKTSLLFAGPGDSSPGWLVRCLSELAFRGVNLVKIESRPARGRLGHYVFLADCEGREEDPAVAEALEGLRGQAELVRVLGSYPAAPSPGVS